MISRTDHTITVAGKITIENVVDITEQGVALLDDTHQQFIVDLSGLTEVDSSVVAMLLEWQRATKDYDKPVQYTGVPGSLEGLIHLYDLSDFIPYTGQSPDPDPA